MNGKQLSLAVPYQELKIRASGRHIKVANTRERWFAIERFYDTAEPSSRKEYLFETTLTSDTEQDTSNILNLQYFFIRTDRTLQRLREAGEDAVFILLVNVNDYADSERVSAYLYAQSIYRTDILFYTRIGRGSCRPLQPIEAVGRISPLLRVTKQPEQGGIPLEVLASGKTLRQEQITECCIEAKEIVMWASKNEERDSEIFNPLIDPNYDFFSGLCAAYLINALTKIRGKANANIDAKEKKDLIDLLGQYIFERSASLSLLGQYIWLMYLAYLEEAKELVEKQEGTSEYALREDRLEKSFADSAAYADGLIQLLENSCLHTQMEKGYFNIRVHYVDRNAPDSKLEHVAVNRVRLRKHYNSKTGENHETPALIPKGFQLHEGIPFYFEITVCDDATYYSKEKQSDGLETKGILAMYVQNRGLGKANVELHDVFQAEEATIFGEGSVKSESGLSRMAHHYGLRLLQKIVMRNRGYLVVSSPGLTKNREEIYSAFLENKKYDGENESNNTSTKVLRGTGWQEIKCKNIITRATEYQILLPISYRWLDAPDENDKTMPTQFPLDISSLKDKCFYYKTLKISLRKLFKSDVVFKRAEATPDSKKEIIDKLCRNLGEQFEVEGTIDWTQDRVICMLDFVGLSGNEIELAAKMLFCYIGGTELALSEGGKSGKRMLFALNFSDAIKKQEFIRNFSVFYDRNGKNPFMQGVQIAICGKNEELDVPEVNFLLAGGSIGTARKTAEIFAYYNSESTLPLLSQIQYLCQTYGEIMDDEEPVEPFPFDLYLQDHFNFEEAKSGTEQTTKASIKIAASCNCWFLQRIAKIICRDVRDQKLGCMISDIHVRLGSKMHIEDFFEAELLFQNVNVVSRFAYLIVQELLKMKPILPAQSVLTVGYENYSTILLEYIVQFLRACGYRSENGVFGNDDENFQTFFPSAELEAMEEAERKDFLKACKLVVICPIGTTLLTVSNMINSVYSFYEEFSGTEMETVNFCLLVVSDGNSEMPRDVLFWQRQAETVGIRRIKAEEQNILLLEESRVSDSRRKVKYFLEAKTHWHMAQECIGDKLEENAVLAYVDSTSTVPNAIFPLTGRKACGVSSFVLPKEKKENDRRLSLLRNCIIYGHISKGDNHFLYDLDLPAYFVQASKKTHNEKNETQQTVRQWLKSLSIGIDAHAFNIIISPLDKSNTAFLKAVVDEVFSHSIRVLRIPIQASRKEDIRAKFSFITREYSEIKESNPEAKVNFYYVDNSIVTGDTFYRGKKLLQMLLEESKLYHGGSPDFAGIFLLVNRSSRNTVATMVQDVDKQFHAYLHLAIPHYNTHRNRCPACEKIKRYRLMVDHSATNSCRQEFVRLEDKHTLRTREENVAWWREQLWLSHGAFNYLRQSLIHSKNRNFQCEQPETKKLYQWLEKIMRAEWEMRKKPTELAPGKRELQTFSMISLSKYKTELKKEELDEVIEKYWLYKVRGEKAYLRLLCTHMAYCEMECDEVRNCPPSKKQEAIVRTKIVKLLQQDRFKTPIEQHVEWVICCVKVLGREYLSKYHHIRQAVFRVLQDMLELLLDEDTGRLEMQDMAQLIKRCKKSYPLHQYQLLITIMQQLASMQANAVVQKLSSFNLKCRKLRDAYMECAQQENVDELTLFCPLPSDEQMEIDYAGCVKWSSLSNDEENKSFLLQENQSIWPGGVSE